jgi:hypothetical protein
LGIDGSYVGGKEYLSQIDPLPTIYSPVAGRVTVAGRGHYNMVEIVTGDGMKHQFLHNGQVLVRPGKIAVGEPIAIMGKAGADSPHMHYQIEDADGNRWDPRAWHNWNDYRNDIPPSHLGVVGSLYPGNFVERRGGSVVQRTGEFLGQEWTQDSRGFSANTANYDIRGIDVDADGALRGIAAWPHPQYSSPYPRPPRRRRASHDVTNGFGSAAGHAPSYGLGGHSSGSTATPAYGEQPVLPSAWGSPTDSGGSSRSAPPSSGWTATSIAGADAEPVTGTAGGNVAVDWPQSPNHPRHGAPVGGDRRPPLMSDGAKLVANALAERDLKTIDRGARSPWPVFEEGYPALAAARPKNAPDGALPRAAIVLALQDRTQGRNEPNEGDAPTPEYRDALARAVRETAADRLRRGVARD